MNKKISTILQYLFFLCLGFFFVWLSIKDVKADDWEKTKSALVQARHYLIVPVLIILVMSHYVRALRWRLLMEPMGYFPTKTNVFFAVFIGYLTNLGVPRLGEVLKCTVLARYEKIPADKLVGTIILERLFDAFCLLVVFGITLLIQPGLYGRLIDQVFKSSATPGEEPAVSHNLIGFIVLGAIVLAIVLWMIIKKKTFGDLVAAIRKIASRAWQGLSSIRHLKKRGQFLLLTCLMWSCYLFGGYIGFKALQETQIYGIPEAFTVLSAGSIGMIISPGGIGGYALLIENTMMMYGLQATMASAFGWLLWIAQTIIILIGGVISFALLPWYNRRRAIVS